MRVQNTGLFIMLQYVRTNVLPLTANLALRIMCLD